MMADLDSIVRWAKEYVREHEPREWRIADWPDIVRSQLTFGEDNVPTPECLTIVMLMMAMAAEKRGLRRFIPTPSDVFNMAIAVHLELACDELVHAGVVSSWQIEGAHGHFGSAVALWLDEQLEGVS